ncbi:MAG: DUF1127 domain-containing protein [Halopseudomonas sp.]
MNDSTLCLRNMQSSQVAEAATKTDWRERLQRWAINWRTRRQLRQLDSYLLKDIGVSRGDAMIEAEKPFWQD